MSYAFSEDGLVEAALEEVLLDLNWQVKTAWTKEKLWPNPAIDERGEDLPPDPSQPDETQLGRANKGEVLLYRYLLPALQTLNPDLPAAAYRQAMELLASQQADQQLVEANRAKHALLTKGVEVSFTDADGVLQKQRLKVFDFAEPENNHFLAVRQFEVVGQLYNRRPDVVGFVNGIPLVFFELKAHSVELRHAYDDNLSDYKDTIPELLHHNALVILSNGAEARVGTVTSPWQFFLEWKRLEEGDAAEISQERLVRGVCEKHRLLDLFENFLLFDASGSRTAKIMAKNHQYIGVNRVINRARNIEELQGQLGVFWHTQGSGKSYSMVFLCEKILRKFGGSYTFLLVVDRSELENQLYDTFTGCGAVREKKAQASVRAKSREHLRELLAENHRYVFTLIHKFSINEKKETAYPLITERKNIIVISDEAHRTQGGIYARNMRYQGIPNATYLGFTGTPLIDGEDERTRDIFGDYVSVYDFKRAIDDEATLPLRYQNRGEKLQLDNPDLDSRMAEIIENEDLDSDQLAKLRRDFARDYPILTSDERLDQIARDLVWHFNERGYQGKAMYVALDKPTAVRLYDRVMAHWPDYVAELEQRITNASDQQEQLKLQRKLARVQETEVCVVVSGEQNEVKKFDKLGLDIDSHREKMVKRDLETEFKDEDNPFRLAIVCAMWITGFDAPCVSTVYLDKPIKGHTLMQTIARANRVHDDEKENGLIIDYGNVYRQLEQAYSVYGEGGRGAGSGKKKDRPVELLEELAEELAASIAVVRDFLAEADFDLNSLVQAETASARLAALKAAGNAVCLNERHRAQFEVAARDSRRKYLALYPDERCKPFTPEHNAIEAINNLLNQKKKAADISEVMRQLQQEVDMSVSTQTNSVRDDDFVNLANLDFDKLREAFAKSEAKQMFVFDLQQAIDAQLQKMCRENPVRLAFYEKYQAIIAEYNSGKDIHAVQKAFDDLKEQLRNEINPELDRAMREGLNEETLALYDLLKKDTLTHKEENNVKNVASDLLARLKAEQLRIQMWRQSTQVCAQVKTVIHDQLQWLPPEHYQDDELADLSLVVYQHIHSQYPGGSTSLYGAF